MWERYVELAEDSSSVITHHIVVGEPHSHLGDTYNLFQPLNESPSERQTILIPTK
jgi:hypothetical protein